MKKGILVVCLALSMVITASAFVQKTISATMKSQDIAYEGNNMNQEVIVYNNTTYVPSRNFSEIVGVPVDYKNGVIYLGDSANQSNTTNGSTESNNSNNSNNNSNNSNNNSNNSNSSNTNSNSSNHVADNGNKLYIGKNEARKIALQHAGVQDDQYTITELKLDRNNNKIVYEVEFFTANKEYDYEIDAITGKIVSYDYDIEGFEIPTIDNNATYIGKEKAEQIALDHAQVTKQQVKYVKNELDKDDGRWEYQIEFKYGNKEYEYEINAYTGEIIDYSVDND